MSAIEIDQGGTLRMRAPVPGGFTLITIPLGDYILRLDNKTPGHEYLEIKGQVVATDEAHTIVSNIFFTAQVYMDGTFHWQNGH